VEYQLRKMPGPILIPMHDEDAERLQQVKNGALMLAEIKQPRNPAFHNKYFAMLNLAYGYWEPPEVELGGLKAEKQFERFRKDIQVLAGYRVAIVNIKGEARYESESISFGSMEEGRFQEVYKNVFSVLWRLILSKVPNLTENEAHNLINSMAEFA
jgi:hypothetical protein